MSPNRSSALHFCRKWRESFERRRLQNLLSKALFKSILCFQFASSGRSLAPVALERLALRRTALSRDRRRVALCGPPRQRPGRARGLFFDPPPRRRSGLWFCKGLSLSMYSVRAVWSYSAYALCVRSLSLSLAVSFCIFLYLLKVWHTGRVVWRGVSRVSAETRSGSGRLGRWLVSARVRGGALEVVARHVPSGATALCLARAKLWTQLGQLHAPLEWMSLRCVFGLCWDFVKETGVCVCV